MQTVVRRRVTGEGEMEPMESEDEMESEDAMESEDKMESEAAIESEDKMESEAEMESEDNMEPTKLEKGLESIEKRITKLKKFLDETMDDEEPIKLYEGCEDLKEEEITNFVKAMKNLLSVLAPGR